MVPQHLLNHATFINIKKQMPFAMLCGVTVLSAHIEKLGKLLQMEVAKVCWKEKS